MDVDVDVDVDVVLSHLGSFGPYQRRAYFLVCLPIVLSAAVMVAATFTAATPTYRCFVPGCDNSSYPQYEEPFLNETIPHQEQDGHVTYSQCEMYTYNESAYNQSCPLGHYHRPVTHCTRSVFDRRVYKSSVVSEFGLTCSKEWLATTVGTVYFSGVLVGAVLFGHLSDMYGRKKALLSCILVQSVSGSAAAFAPNIAIFLVLQFLSGFGNASIFTTAFVIGLEFVGSSHRVMCGVVIEYFFAVGEALVGVIAWWLRDWRYIQLAISAPSIVFLSYYWFLPESARWLVSKGRHAEARDIVREAARVNGVTLPEGILNSGVAEGEALFGAKEKGHSSPQSMIGIFRSRRLAVRSINIFFNWLVNTIVYYGLSFNSSSLGGDKYWNFVLVSLVEIPGYTFSWVAMKYWGRRPSLVASLLLSSVACIGAALVPRDPAQQAYYYLQMGLFLVGKFGITSSFSTIYLFSAELFPTLVRNAALGVSSMCSRVGGILAPVIAGMSVYGESVPLLVFGGLGLVAGFLSLALPETLGSKLPDTVEEAERFGRNRSLSVQHDEEDETAALLPNEIPDL